MPDTDPPPLKAKRGVRKTPAPAKAVAAAQPQPADSTPAALVKPPPIAATEAGDVEVAADTPESPEPTPAESESTKAQTPKTASTPPVDPFHYDASTLTLSFSFLPLTEGGAGRTVIVSVHSKNGTGNPVLPEFMAPLHESDLHLPASVLRLLERYRTVTLPKRKAEAEAKAAALAAKRPVTQSKGKGLRPEHVPVKTTSRVKPGVATQTKLKFGK